MSENDSEPKPDAAVLIIGTCHEYQRHQDANAEREGIRREFEQLIRASIVGKSITLIAEEAGKNEEVHAQLRADEAKTPSDLAVLFNETKAVDDPPATIAKIVADEFLNRNHVDIRPPNADRMTIAQRDKAMATKTIESLGSAKNVLVICGESIVQK